MNKTFTFIVLTLLTIMCAIICFVAPLTGMKTWFGILTLVSGFCTFCFAYEKV